MAEYRPSLPFSMPMKLLIPIYTKINGVEKKILPTIEDGILIFGTFKTFGGTDTTSNGILFVEDTANIETWYRPDITSSCSIGLENGAIYEIIGEPENINMRNQFLKLKVRRRKGGA